MESKMTLFICKMQLPKTPISPKTGLICIEKVGPVYNFHSREPFVILYHCVNKWVR